MRNMPAYRSLGQPRPVEMSMCFTAASSRIQPSNVMREPRRTNGKRAWRQSDAKPASRQKARPERYTGMVWICAEEEVKPRFCRTVG